MKTRDWLREYQDEAVWMILGPMLLGFGLRKVIYEDAWLAALGLFLVSGIFLFKSRFAIIALCRAEPK